MSTDSEGDSVEDVLKSLGILLGLVYFISLLIFDACVAIVGKPARNWTPGKYLVISALTIQILSYLEIKIIKYSDDEFIDKDILQNEFVGESGRVVTCVLIGYLLPGMARAGSVTDWTTVAALVLSLFTSEFYYLTYNLINYGEFYFAEGSSLASEEDLGNYRIYFYSLVSNFVIIWSTIMVVLFSISAILAGRTIRGMLAQKVSAIQWDKRKESEGVSWQKFEGDIVESWFLARVCHPQYVIARSVLSSAVGLVVIICILFLAIRQFVLYWWFLHEFFNYYILFMAWTLEWSFILIGGTVIFCRWFTAVVYFPRFFVTKMKLRGCTRSFVEDFWTRGISELVQMYNLQKWHLQEQSKDGILKELLLRMATTMKVHYLLYLLWPLQISIVCFSKCCLFISELVFSFKFLWSYLLGSDRVSSRSDFEEYREILEKVCMPGENPEGLWVANEKSMKQAKNHFNESKNKGSNCNDLIALIAPHFYREADDGGRFVDKLERLPHVAKHPPALDENCMRMTALSLLNVIIILLPLHKDEDRLTKAIKTYRQGLDLMSFVDNSDPPHPTTIDVLKVIDIEADRVSVAVLSEFQSLIKLQKEKVNSLQKSPNLTAPEAAPDRAIKDINELLEKAEEQLKEQKLATIKKEKQSGVEEQNVGEEYCDSRDWSAIIASYSKYRVCKLILSRDFNNANELMEYLYGSLADVIVYCLLKLPDVLVKTCREWAVKFEEEKIWDAIYIAGKAVGVMQKCDTELKVSKV